MAVPRCRPRSRPFDLTFQFRHIRLNRLGVLHGDAENSAGGCTTTAISRKPNPQAPGAGPPFATDPRVEGRHFSPLKYLSRIPLKHAKPACTHSNAIANCEWLTG